MRNSQSVDTTRLIVDGCNFYPAIFYSIEQAESTLFIENYLVEEGALFDRFIQSIERAASRGVQVRAIFDGFGASQVHSELLNLNHNPNIEIKIFNPIRLRLGTKNLRRTHIKLFIIDDKLAYTGGAGITDYFYNPITGYAPWSEVMVSVEGESVGMISSLFINKFNMLGSKAKSLLLPVVDLDQLLRPRMEGWLYAHHLTTHLIKRALYKNLAKAQDRIWINSAYFYPTRKTLKYLIAKARAGVDVRLLLPGVSDVWFMKYLARGRYKKLLNAGVTIHELNDRFLHSKVVIIDGWATVGSFNLDVFSFRFNHELNYASSDAQFIESLEGFFLSKLQSADEITPHKWTNRQFLSRLLELIAHKCALMLEKLIK